MKTLIKILMKTVVAIVSLLFLLWILIQTPGVQTFVVKKVVDSLEEKFNGRIEFSKVHFRPFNALVLKDVVLLDNDPATTVQGERLDTIAKAQSIVATFSLKGLARKEGIHVHRASISNGSFTFTNEERGSNIKRFLNSQPKDSTKTTESKLTGNVFDISKLQVRNFRFRMISPSDSTAAKEGCVNLKDLDLKLNDVQAKKLKLSGGVFSGVLDKFSAEEKSGYAISKFTAKVRAGGGNVVVEDLKFRDNWSSVNIPEFSFAKAEATDAGKANIIAVLDESTVDIETVGAFVPSMKGRNVRLALEKVDFNGILDDIYVNSLAFREENSGIEGAIEGHVTGLPDLNAVNLDVTAKSINFSTDGAGKLIKGFAPSVKIDLGKMLPGETASFNGRGTGSLNRLNFKGNLLTSVGDAVADIRINDLLNKKKSTSISGNLSTKDLNIGKIAGIKQIGELSLHGTMSADLGKEMKVQIDTVFIDKLQALGYSYSNIIAAGTYSDKAFDGRIICNDPNLSFLFQGVCALSDKTDNGLYKFYASIGYADLNALHIDKRGTSKVSGQINANYMSVKKEGIIGDLDVTNLSLENDEGIYDIGDICVKSHSNDEIHRIILTSTFANATYVGTRPITAIASDIQDLTTKRELPVLYSDAKSKWKGDDYDISCSLSDTRSILAFVKPGLYVADSTNLKMKISKDGQLKATVNSPRLALGKNYLKNLSITLDNSDGSLNGIIKSSDITASALSFLNSQISLYAKDNKIALGCAYDNKTDIPNKGDLHLTGELARAANGNLIIHGKTLPSNIVYDNEAWNISQSSIEVNGKNIDVSGLTGRCGEQSISINGGFSTTTKDTLKLDLNKFDMALLDRLTAKDYGFEGKASGHAIVTSPWKGNAGLMMNLTCDDAKMADEEIGTLKLAGSLDDSGKLHVIARNDLNGSRTMNITADYFTKDKQLMAEADLNKFNGGYFKPFVKSFFSDMEGDVSGKIRMNGKFSDLNISSEDMRLDNALIRIGYTNVPYWCTGPIHVDNSGVFFDNVAVKDRLKGTGTASGGITWNKFKDMRMDTHIRMRDMEAFNLEEKDNPYFYGNTIASGTVSITGPFSAMLLDVNAMTGDNSNVHIPLNNRNTASKNDLLTFKEPERKVYVDPYDVMMNNITASKKSSRDFRIKVRINANPNTEAFVEIDRSAGNVLSGHGQGIIELDIQPNRKYFAINGDYTLSEGNFHFNAMDIAKRNFTISDGSSIHFKGDVMESDLDINGMYSTKASIATLISDTTAVSSRRLVNCEIGISGKLREPQLSFNIDIPDLDPTTKANVESALNTDDKVQRQFLSLLISNSFMPDEQSGIVNNSSMIYSNVAEIMAGQLNNILQKLNIPLDFGLNYQSSESGTSIFDVAVSTQLFNNRVLVNGAFGNREYRNSSSESDVAGDLDVEIKLDKTGQLRMTLFSHSADDYTSYLDNTQRSGVGVAYQKEFNTMKEFVRDLFTRKKKREGRTPPPEREYNKVYIKEENRQNGK